MNSDMFVEATCLGKGLWAVSAAKLLDLSTSSLTDIVAEGKMAPKLDLAVELSFPNDSGEV